MRGYCSSQRGSRRGLFLGVLTGFIFVATLEIPPVFAQNQPSSTVLYLDESAVRRSIKTRVDPEMPAAALVKCLVEAADTFAAGAPQHDDMTLLVLKMLPKQTETTPKA